MGWIRFCESAAIALIFVPLAAAQSYNVTDLGTLPGGTYSKAAAVNNHGAVVGNADSSNGAEHAFLWTPTGGMKDLGTLPGDDGSEAYAINDSGVIVGQSYKDGVGAHAVLWTQAGKIRYLGSLGGSVNGYAYGINDSGQVVGESSLAGNTAGHAFLWTDNAGMQDLGTLGGNTSVGYAINDLGEVAGYSLVTGGGASGHAFMWTQASGMQDLGLVGGTAYSTAAAISASGSIVGYAGSISGDTTSFLWTKSSGMKALGTGDTSVADGINNSGDVVGNVEPGGNVSAFIWSPTQREQNLNDLIPPNSGWFLEWAMAINRSGQIAAIGSINGQSHGALLTPAN